MPIRQESVVRLEIPQRGNPHVMRLGNLSRSERRRTLRSAGVLLPGGFLPYGAPGLSGSKKMTRILKHRLSVLFNVAWFSELRCLPRAVPRAFKRASRTNLMMEGQLWSKIASEASNSPPPGLSFDRP